MSQSRFNSVIFGSLTLINNQSNLGARITNLGYPIDDNDATNKYYVDSKLRAADISAGIGLSLNTSNNIIINVLPSQTQITEIGNINIGSWQSDTILVPYGGTGNSIFTPNKLLLGNGTSAISTANNLDYNSNLFTISVPLLITNTNNALGNSNASLSILGGVNITKNLIVGSDVMISGNISVNNISITGDIVLNTLSAQNSIYTNISSNNIICNNFKMINMTGSNILSNNITTNNLIAYGISVLSSCNISNISSSNLSVNNSTISNTIITNISANTIRTSLAVIGSITSTNCTMSSVHIPLLLTSTNNSFTNLSSNNIVTFFSSINNLSSSNITFSNLNVNNTTNSTTISSSNIYSINMFNTNFSSSNSTCLNSNITNLTSNSSNITNNSSVNISNTNMTSSNISNINLTSSNISNINLTSSNISNINLTSSNISNINLTSSNIFSSNIFSSNISNVNLTSSNIYSSNIISENITNNFITSNNTLSTNSTINSLNVVGNISNSNGNILTKNIIFTNSTISNIFQNGIAVLGSVNCINITTGNIYSINTSLVNLLSMNSTLSNVISTNLTTNNIKVSSLLSTYHYSENSTLSNTIVLNSTISSFYINSDANFKKNIIINSNFQANNSYTSGSFFSILPSSFTDLSPTGNINSWYANYIASPTLSALNTLTTLKTTNMYIQSNIIRGANQSLIYNSALTLGYVQNNTGSNLTGQIMFERNDGNWYSSIYTENISNRLNIVNSSFSGGGGVGIISINPITFDSVNSSTNIIPITFASFSKESSIFYSTKNAINSSTGALVINGGLGIKNIYTSSLETSLFSTPNYNLIIPIEGGYSEISNIGIVLNGIDNLVNYNLNFPTDLLDGQHIFITSNINITNVSFSNSNIPVSNIIAYVAKKYIYISNISNWFSC